MSAFVVDKFKFLGLSMSGAKVLAKVRESDGFSRPIHTPDEEEIHSWLARTVELIGHGENGKIALRNREELTAAFNAIRTYKAQNGIPLDVRNPCI